MPECRDRSNRQAKRKVSMTLKTPFLLAALLSLTAGVASAAPGPEAACQALSAQVREAVALKKQGTAVGSAVDAVSAQPVPASVPADQHSFYQAKLPGATRFAFMAGMSGDDAAAFYLKQCLQGS
jgi:hypothetical protein